MAFNFDIFLFGSEGVLNRAKTFAGGLYVFLIVWYVLLIAVDNFGRSEFVLLESTRLWYGAVVGGSVLVSAWLGYSNGGLVVAGAVGLAFPAAFVTLGTIFTALGLNEPDAPLWFIAAFFFVVGVALAVAGFVVGWGVRFAISS